MCTRRDSPIQRGIEIGNDNDDNSTVDRYSTCLTLLSIFFNFNFRSIVEPHVTANLIILYDIVVFYIVLHCAPRLVGLKV